MIGSINRLRRLREHEQGILRTVTARTAALAPGGGESVWLPGEKAKLRSLREEIAQHA